MVKGNKRRRGAAGITAAEPKRVSGVGAVPPRSRVKFMHFSVCRVWRRAPVFGGAPTGSPKKREQRERFFGGIGAAPTCIYYTGARRMVRRYLQGMKRSSQRYVKSCCSL